MLITIISTALCFSSPPVNVATFGSALSENAALTSSLDSKTEIAIDAAINATKTGLLGLGLAGLTFPPASVAIGLAILAIEAESKNQKLNFRDMGDVWAKIYSSMHNIIDTINQLSAIQEQKLDTSQGIVKLYTMAQRYSELHNSICLQGVKTTKAIELCPKIEQSLADTMGSKEGIMGGELARAYRHLEQQNNQIEAIVERLRKAIKVVQNKIEIEHASFEKRKKELTAGDNLVEESAFWRNLKSTNVVWARLNMIAAFTSLGIEIFKPDGWTEIHDKLMKVKDWYSADNEHLVLIAYERIRDIFTSNVLGSATNAVVASLHICQLASLSHEGETVKKKEGTQSSNYRCEIRAEQAKNKCTSKLSASKYFELQHLKSAHYCGLGGWNYTSFYAYYHVEVDSCQADGNKHRIVFQQLGGNRFQPFTQSVIKDGQCSPAGLKNRVEVEFPSNGLLQNKKFRVLTCCEDNAPTRFFVVEQ